MTPQTGLALGQLGLLLAYFIQAIRVAAFERKLQKFIAQFRKDGRGE
jgi:hypothetical protein